ncbi:glutaminase [Bacteroidales bacterium]|nr:glutaminase [Bacteroidales bacterium]
MGASLATDLFKTTKKIDLRAPSVPLITSDPYLSIWSPYNKLTEGNTEHWTAAEHPLIGAIRVDGQVYRFMGKDNMDLKPIAAMTHFEHWEASYTNVKPSAAWFEPDFDDSSWKKGEAAFGSEGMKRIKTPWKDGDIWIRREIDLSTDISKESLFLKYSHDDEFELYLNGEKLIETGYSWKDDVVLQLSEQTKKNLRKGKNVIAAHCANKAGGAYVDFGLYSKAEVNTNFNKEAIQTALNVMPTQTYYTFTCGAVELDLVFTSPLLMDDLDLISTPISYISYRVRALDKKAHEVQVYIHTSPELAVHQTTQATVSETIAKNGMMYLKTGTIDQAITERIGDNTRIDWGYAYLASDKEGKKNLCLGKAADIKESFIASGKLPRSQQSYTTRAGIEWPIMAYVDNLGMVDGEGKSGYLMLGYDDIYAIEYFHKKKMAYWKHNGAIGIFDAFERAKSNYQSVMNRCRSFDLELISEAENAGGKEYAEICALTYRQTIAAHKLLTDDDGNLLFLSKENHSNGCINTVDLTYPSAPLFLLYNTDLLKGMLTPIFYYSESGRWNKPFPAHDLGTYPIANGQLYGGDMPVEEAGNMILATAAASIIDGNADYAMKHWKTLSIWVEYLAEKGLDPENQLCTDDFAGHLAHNANLSAKAIMAIAAYGEMAKMMGMVETHKQYNNLARTMAKEWEAMAKDGDHYKLAFDKSGSWSQKYNMVWDDIFDWNIFPSQIIKTEIPFYLSKQKKYGLPLDSRMDYTKSDWVIWTACMADNDETFAKFIAPIYKYANETSSRVPMSDWHDTNTGNSINFKARSVVGGYYMKMLKERVKSQSY